MESNCPVLKSLAYLKEKLRAGCQWLMPINLATQVVDIRKIVVRTQPRQLVHELLS
jgi:hypothetical protein